ncbi:hypothetical protein FRX31_032054, partial [Thalictrum thalictroides]
MPSSSRRDVYPTRAPEAKSPPNPVHFDEVNVDDQQTLGWTSRAIADLMKIYQNNKKYGDGQEILDIKLEIFYDYCDKLNISEAQYANAFSAMLKGSA